MRIVVVAVVLMPVVMVLVWAGRRSRRSRDSVRRFSDAVSVLREISTGPDFAAARREDGEARGLAEVMPLPIGRPGHHRARASRPEPDELARRPIIATLPSMPAAPAKDGGQQAG